MHHGIVDVFAYQEALLIEVGFGISLLAMIWLGFRHWLRHKDKMGQLIADRTAEVAAQHGARMEWVEARLKAVEQQVGAGTSQAPALVDSAGTALGREPISRRDEV